MREILLQGYLANKKPPPSLEPPQDPRYSPAVGSQEEGVCYERGTPVVRSTWCGPLTRPDAHHHAPRQAEGGGVLGQRSSHTRDGAPDQYDGPAANSERKQLDLSSVGHPVPIQGVEDHCSCSRVREGGYGLFSQLRGVGAKIVLSSEPGVDGIVPSPEMVRADVPRPESINTRGMQAMVLPPGLEGKGAKTNLCRTRE